MTYAAKAFTMGRDGGWRRGVRGPIRDALMKLDPTSAALGSLAGIAAGTFAVPALADTLQGASYVSLASATGLAMAAAATVLRSRGKAKPLPDAYPRVRDGFSYMRQPKDCRTWLAEKAAMIPSEVVPADARVRDALATHLTPNRIALEPCHRLLHVSFAMHEAGTHFREGNPTTKLGVHDVLREVQALHAYDDSSVEAYLTDLEARIGGKSWETLTHAVAVRRKRHGSRETALMGALEAARDRRGMLACAEFRWLRVVDRDLWFSLQNLGRHEGFVEGLAALSHYRAEKAAGEALAEWHLDAGVSWVEDSLRSATAA